jgi:hypothetical protein
LEDIIGLVLDSAPWSGGKASLREPPLPLRVISKKITLCEAHAVTLKPAQSMYVDQVIGGCKTELGVGLDTCNGDQKHHEYHTEMALTCSVSNALFRGLKHLSGGNIYGHFLLQVSRGHSSTCSSGCSKAACL